MESEEGKPELDELDLGCLIHIFFYCSTLWILKYVGSLELEKMIVLGVELVWCLSKFIYVLLARYG